MNGALKKKKKKCNILTRKIQYLFTVKVSSEKYLLFSKHWKEKKNQLN